MIYVRLLENGWGLVDIQFLASIFQTKIQPNSTVICVHVCADYPPIWMTMFELVGEQLLKSLVIYITDHYLPHNTMHISRLYIAVCPKIHSLQANHLVIILIRVY